MPHAQSAFNRVWNSGYKGRTYSLIYAKLGSRDIRRNLGHDHNKNAAAWRS